MPPGRAAASRRGVDRLGLSATGAGRGRGGVRMKVAQPQATMTLAVATAVAYALVILFARNDHAAFLGGFVPARIEGLQIAGALPLWITPLSATLIHAGLLHLGFNLLMLVYCGREDEVALGPWGVVALYVAGAYAAAAGQWLAGPRLPVPMIGCSGAVSALVGAYAILYGQRRPSRLHPELARWLHVLWLAAAWIVLQLLLTLGGAFEGVSIAAAAHVGGFLVGLVLARPLLRWRYRGA